MADAVDKLPGSLAPPPVLTGLRAARWYRRFFSDPVGCLRDAHARNGPLTAIGSVLPGRRGHLHVFALGPQYNRQVLGSLDDFRTTGQTIAGPRDSAQRRTRFGLTRMNGAVHQQQRALILPLFQKKAVEAWVPQMIASASHILDGWRAGSTIDASEQMRRLSLRIASDSLFDRENPSRAEALGELIGAHLARNFSPTVWMLPMNLPLTPYRRLLRSAERLEKTILDLVDDRRRRPGDDVFSLLVQAYDAGEGLKDPSLLVGQAVILFGASYETTSNALTWTLYLLAQHPRVANDVIDELDAVLAGQPPTMDDFKRLPLLEACVKESMRILPPVPFTIRVAMKRAMLGPLPVKSGDRIVCSHYITHHLPELYPDPERFDPQRWFTIRPSSYEYLPFSAGPRMCLGYTFAMTAIMISLAMILQRFRFTVVPGSRIDRRVRVTMGPRRGLPLNLFAPDRRFETSQVTGNVHEMVRVS